MDMLYNSDSFVVVHFEVPSSSGEPSALSRGGYEIVDKFARQEIYLQGAAAEGFKRDVQALVDTGTSEEDMDEFLSGFMVLGRHPLALH